MIVAKVAVPARRGPDAGALPDRVRRAVLPHLAHRNVVVVFRPGRAGFGRRARGGDGRCMHVRRMHAVQMVLQHQLPVSLVGMLEDPAGDLQPAARRAVDEVAEGTLCRAEKILQAGACGGKRSENEPAVARHPGNPAQSQRDERFRFVAGSDGHRAKFARPGVAPAVVRADEALGVAPALGADRGASVQATIDEHRDRAVVLARHDHRLARHPGGEVITGARYLAFVPEQQPGAAEHALHLEFEYRRVGVHGAVHPIGLHQH